MHVGVQWPAFGGLLSAVSSIATKSCRGPSRRVEYGSTAPGSGVRALVIGECWSRKKSTEAPQRLSYLDPLLASSGHGRRHRPGPDHVVERRHGDTLEW
jgi:hypothetical protein